MILELEKDQTHHFHLKNITVLGFKFRCTQNNKIYIDSYQIHNR